MTTKLMKPFRRELEVGGEPFTVTVGRDGVRIARKGFRRGASVTWNDLLLATAAKPGPRA